MRNLPLRNRFLLLQWLVRQPLIHPAVANLHALQLLSAGRCVLALRPIEDNGEARRIAVNIAKLPGLLQKTIELDHLAPWRQCSRRSRGVTDHLLYLVENQALD
jgi:hypothetical protein